MNVNLPIAASASVVSGAAKLARQVSQGLGRALEFDAILHHDPAADMAALKTESIGLIRDALTAIGVVVNQSLRLDVTSGGGIRVADDHPRAAEMELELTSNAQIQSVIKRLSAQGVTQLTIDPA